MFRRLPHTLPADPTFPADLDQLGFFVEPQKDVVRQKRDPARKYQYKINRNDRVNEVYRSACNFAYGLAALRQIVQDRLSSKGFEALRLPLGAGPDDPHVPILVSSDISRADRVTVFFGERHLQPGILSWRVMGEEGIRVGSIVQFAEAAIGTTTMTEAVHSESAAHPSVAGMVIANPCQLLWYRGGSRAVSDAEWLDLPRPSAVHEAMKVDPTKNRIPHNRDYEQHVQYVLGEVLPKILHADAKIDIVAVEYPGSAVVEYLAEHWATYSSVVDGIALINPQHQVQDLPTNEAFSDFLSRRGRAYLVSQSELDTPVPPAAARSTGCNAYSSGEPLYEEAAVVRCWPAVLRWFRGLHQDPAAHEEIPIVTDGTEEDDKGAEEIQIGW